METALLAVVSAIIGAVATWMLTNLWPSRDARRLVEAQERIARIEQERNDWEQRYRKLVGFAPTWRIIGRAPDPQFIEIKANEAIEAFQLDYLMDTSACVVSQALDLQGREVRVPLIRDYVDQVHRKKYHPVSGAADVRFRVLVRVLGEQREIIVPARIENQPLGSNYYRDVIG